MSSDVSSRLCDMQQFTSFLRLNGSLIAPLACLVLESPARTNHSSKWVALLKNNAAVSSRGSSGVFKFTVYFEGMCCGSAAGQVWPMACCNGACHLAFWACQSQEALCCRVDITQGAARAPKLDHCELIAHDNRVGALSVLGLVLGRNLFMSVAADQLNIFMTANFVSWIQTVCPAVTVLFPRNVSAPFEYSFNVG